MIWMGAGATLSLVIAMLIFARSKNMREVARLGAGRRCLTLTSRSCLACR